MISNNTLICFDNILKTKKVTVIKGVVIDKITKKPLINKPVILVDKFNQELDELKTNLNGEFSTVISPNTDGYLYIDIKGYLPRSVFIKKGQSSVYMSILLFKK